MRHNPTMAGEHPRADLRPDGAPVGIGRYVYGAAAIALGLVGLWWGQFATIWQPVPDAVAQSRMLADASALALVAAGVGLQFAVTRRGSAIFLAISYGLFALLWFRRVAVHPEIFATWAGVAEQAALVVAALLIAAANTSHGLSQRTLIACRMAFGICAICYGVLHLVSLKETAAMVPAWLPGSGRFWAIATAVGDLAAGTAFLSGLHARLAARLLTAMFAGFGLFVWLPIAAGAPHEHISWAGNAVNLALVGAAWVLADALSGNRAYRESGRFASIADPKERPHFVAS